jgi:hypothetical protein
MNDIQLATRTLDLTAATILYLTSGKEKEAVTQNAPVDNLHIPQWYESRVEKSLLMG